MEPSLAQLIACCRFGFMGGDPRSLRALLDRGDGVRLAELARRHRVEGIVWRALNDADAHIDGAESLALDARRIAAAGLRLAAESARLHRVLASASVPHLFLKGQALGMLAWGAPYLKRQVDLDLLVPPGAIGKVAGLLGSLGFVQEVPEPSVDPADWHRRHKESVWRSDDGVLLDLHSRAADNKRLLPQLTAALPPKRMEVANGIVLPTVPDALLLPYLAVHGSSSAWFRLKWLADFAALVHRTPAPQLADLADKAPFLGAGRTLSAALVLSHRLFGTPVPDGLWFDVQTGRLVKLSLAMLADPREPTAHPLGTWRIHLAQLLMAPGSRFFFGELVRQAGSALTR